MPSRLEKDFTVADEKEQSYSVPNYHGRLDEPTRTESSYRSHQGLPLDYSRSQTRPSAAHRYSNHAWVARTRYPYEESPTRQRQEGGMGPEDYDVPENYENLDELTAPAPIEPPNRKPHDEPESRLSISEQGSSSDGTQKRYEGMPIQRDCNTTELAAPAPVEEYTSRRSNGFHPSPSGSGDGRRALPNHENISRFATQLYTVSYLIIFSIFGTLARLGLQALTFYPGAPVQTGVLWANFAGSLIMGFLSEDQKLFRENVESSESTSQARNAHRSEKQDRDDSDPEIRQFSSAARKQATSRAHAAIKKTIPLYIGLATGFCGSFTSFSSFMRDAFLALSNALPVPVSHTSTAPFNTGSTVHRNGGYSFMALCAVIILTVFLCLSALICGAHLAIALEPITPRIPYLFARKVVDRTMVIIAWGAWLGAIFLAIWPPDRPGGPIGQSSWSREFWRGDALFALVFAPLGCLLRFYASLHLNGLIQTFPLGTLVVNLAGTAMEGMLYDLQHVPLAGRVGCQVLQGLEDGFCGCLTTVSTLVAELQGLRMRHGYIYGATSVVVGVSLMVVIMGSVQWTVGFRPPLCSHK